jgi:hypothetical protein
MTSSAAVARVREAAGIVAVIQPYVRLRTSGPTMTGLCPFHKDSNASLSVDPDKGLFHCFGCGKAGDAYTFLQLIEGWNFRQSLEYLSERTGVSLEPTPHVASRKDERRAIDEARDSVWYWGHARRRLSRLDAQARWLEREACRRYTPETVPETAWLVFIAVEALDASDLALIDGARPANLYAAYRTLPARTRKAVHRARLEDEHSVRDTIAAVNAVFEAAAAQEATP